jgi:hypothetical protein
LHDIAFAYTLLWNAIFTKEEPVINSVLGEQSVAWRYNEKWCENSSNLFTNSSILIWCKNSHLWNSMIKTRSREIKINSAFLKCWKNFRYFRNLLETKQPSYADKHIYIWPLIKMVCLQKETDNEDDHVLYDYLRLMQVLTKCSGSIGTFNINITRIRSRNITCLLLIKWDLFLFHYYWSKLNLVDLSVIGSLFFN